MSIPSKADHFINGMGKPGLMLLSQHTHQGGQGFGSYGGDFAPVEKNPALIAVNTHDGFNQCAFTSTIGAYQHKKIILINMEGNPIHYGLMI